jgi:hypothetical protein
LSMIIWNPLSSRVQHTLGLFLACFEETIDRFVDPTVTKGGLAAGPRGYVNFRYIAPESQLTADVGLCVSRTRVLVRNT